MSNNTQENTMSEEFNLTGEYFYGVTLSSINKSESWDPKANDESPVTNKLLINQALLGPEAAAGEVNVVQVETLSSFKSLIKIPLVILKIGEARQLRLDIEFPDPPVTFTLLQGAGPVHLMGMHIFEIIDDLDEEIEEEELEEKDEIPF